MTNDEQKDINNLASELVYERIKFSPLWNVLENAQIDAKTEDFKALILLHLEDLIAQAELELEREAEARKEAA